MNASMKAAVHLGIDHEKNSSATRTPEFSEIRPSFSITQKEVIDQQNEIFGISTMDWDKIPWMRSILLQEDAFKVIDSNSVRLLRLGTLFQRQNCRVPTICAALEELNWLVYTNFSVSWAGQYRWRTSRAREEDFTRAQTFSRRDSRIEPSSCRCTTTLTGGRKGHGESCLPVSRSSQHWMQNRQTDTRGQGSGWHKFTATSGPDHVWPDILSSMSNAAQRREEQQWAFWKTRSSTMRDSWEASILSTRLFLSVYLDEMKFAGKKQNSRSYAEEMDETRCDLGEPTSFLDHVYLGCTQRAWKPDDSVVDENRKMFESWIYICQSDWKVAWLREIACEHDRLVLWHGRTCVQRYCEMANKTMEQLY